MCKFSALRKRWIKARRASLRCGVVIAGGAEKIIRDSPLDDAQHLSYRRGMSGEQIAQCERHAQNPLVQGCSG